MKNFPEKTRKKPKSPSEMYDNTVHHKCRREVVPPPLSTQIRAAERKKFETFKF